MLRGLITRAVDVQLDAAHRYQDWFVQSLVRGPSPRYWLTSARELSHLGVTYYRSMAELGRQIPAQAARRPGGEPDGRDHTGSSGTKLEVALQAPLGAQAHGVVVLANNNTVATDVSFLVSEFEGDDGSPPFRASLMIEPPRLALGPLGEAPVTLAVLLDPAVFRAGARYRGTIMVRGHEDRELRVSVVVEGTGDDPS